MTDRPIRPRRFAWLLLVLAAPILAACSVLVSPSPESTPVRRPDLAAAIERWRAAGIDDYAFSISRSCFCPETGPFRVVVVDGVVQAVTAGGQAVAPGEVEFVPLTVPALFAHLQGLDPAASFEATFDPVTGLPISISVDPIENAIDDEYGFTVSEFAAGA